MHRLRFTVLLLALLPFAASTAIAAGHTATPISASAGKDSFLKFTFSSESREGGVSGQAGERGGYIMLAGGGISLNQAISMVERRFKARVVRSDVRQEGDRKIYVLRLLDDSGNAQVVRVDAASGQIM